ncbi:MAG TPA: sterol desaturase family protein [Burkholderiaceae bacterium]|nr:sterol desaturase family protein [Burkholderiaceae bacterium]HRH05619.1 sterol desaturase family protein [Burkholderiaceae bacterium]
MKPMLFAIPVFLFLIALELWVARSRGLTIYRLKDSITSLNIGLISEFTKAIGGVISAVMFLLISKNFGAYEWDTKNPLTWISALILYDFCYYWVHRAGHEINIMWASHVVHHSSEEFNLSTALRQSSTGFFFRWIFYIPMALLGYPLQVFVVVGLIDLLYQYWVHTQLIGKLGWMEKIFITPSNHRVHHGQNDYCIDKNYGGILCIWDRMFGTYADELDQEKPVYGIRRPLESWNPLWANVHHYVQIWHQIKSTSNWRHKLMYLFAKPSWSPDVADTTAIFATTQFKRFDTHTPQGLVRIAIVMTALASAMLMVFYVMQTRMPMALNVAYSALFVLMLTLIGWRMTQARETMPSPAASTSEISGSHA